MLIDAVADAPIGSTGKMKVIREGKTLQFDVKIADRPNQNEARRSGMEKREHFGQKAPEDLGFSLADMNDQIRRDFRIEPDNERGPVVVQVDPRGKAEVAGIMPGDVILEVNRKAVKNTKEALAQFRKGTNTVRIARGPGVVIIVF